MNNFSMEEIIPLVAELTEKYTSRESTSVSYNTARQLMGAVLYCINEAGSEAASGALVSCDGDEAARQLYERGRELVLAKVMDAKKLYEGMLIGFNSYGNRCCHETVVKGLPAFFKNYDVRYNPQNHILTLDYPTMGSLKKLRGVDRIYEYLKNIHLEQVFLNSFSTDYVKAVLEHSDGRYEELFVNMCRIVMRNMIGHLLLEKPVSETGFREEEYEKLCTFLDGKMADEVKEILTENIGLLTAKLFDGDAGLTNYLLKDAEDFTAELMNGAEHGSLQAIFIY